MQLIKCITFGLFLILSGLLFAQGKKHQVKRMFDAVGLSVTNLKRVRMNKLELPNLKPGEYKFIQKSDIL